MKKLFLFAHRWFGISVGFYFVLLGLTGSFLVYRDTFQAWLEPGPRHANSAAVPAVPPVEAALHSARAQLKIEKDFSRIWIPENPSRNLEISFAGLPGMGRGQLLTFEDPLTGEYRAQENFRETWGGKLFVFHHDLFMGATGRTIMGISGLLMLFILISGLYLWLPQRNFWNRLYRLGPLRSPLQTQIELHKFFGFWTSALMIMVTFSGVYISKPAWFQKMPERGGRGSEPVGGFRVDPPQLQRWIGKLKNPRPWEIRYEPKDESLLLTDGAGDQLRVNARTFKPEEGPAPSMATPDFFKLQKLLHRGRFWGSAGEVLVFLAGLLPLFFYVTGFLIWWKKSSKRNEARRERSI